MKDFEVEEQHEDEGEGDGGDEPVPHDVANDVVGVAPQRRVLDADRLARLVAPRRPHLEESGQVDDQARREDGDDVEAQLAVARVRVRVADAEVALGGDRKCRVRRT